MGAVYVCGGVRFYRRMIRPCPTCQRRTRFVIGFSGAYYGEELTCVRCGDSWSEGERQERPFRRGWRDDARRRARAAWDVALPPAEYDRRVRADITAAVSS